MLEYLDMKKNSSLFTSLFLAFLLFACKGNKNTDTDKKPQERNLKVIRIKGSETVRPVVEKVIEQFATINPNIYVEYEGGGSGLGLMALKQQETDIAFVSRPFTRQEQTEIDTAKKFAQRNMAYDGISIVVNLANPLKEISTEQLQGIYSGKITNWKELGGKELPILVYSRDVSSGTFTFFKEKVLDTLDYTKEDINLVHNKEIVNNILQSPGAIGYVGHGSIDPNLKVLKLAARGSTKFIEPNYASIKSGDYSLSRNLYYLFPKNSPDYVLQLDSFLHSPTVKQIITETGFIPE